MKKPYLIPIKHDLFDVASRLREIDANYRLYYNKVASKYEVHNVAQRGNTLAVSLPYESLDARSLLLVRQTRVENAQKLFDEMEKSNAIVEQTVVRNAVDRYAKEIKL